MASAIFTYTTLEAKYSHGEELGFSRPDSMAGGKGKNAKREKEKKGSLLKKANRTGNGT
jgi:hypothetical protein